MSVAARRGGRFVRRLAHRLTAGSPRPASAIWETIQLARHQDRPYPLDYIGAPVARVRGAARGPPLRRRPGHRGRHRPRRRTARWP